MSRTVYRAPIALGVRGLGFGAVGLGACVVGATLIRAADVDGPLGVVLWVTLGILAAVALVFFGTGTARAAGLRSRLVLDEDGFLNATGPGAGVRRVAWRDVRKVQADGSVVSVDVAGSRQSLIRTSALDVDPRELARELRSRLNRNRGYTPLGSAQAERVDGVGR
ncbi:hypothetical protein [Phytoactinopolyspora halotolerans]|uniref:PH domain-containing protein n=1 Tax=Phytoactinopolyspora halotolerans TaxID=1981512 RepID=A0A6L9S374_9ACTN|nr:hypothetical protein [Phytoactinopolyspora halotolerans]NED99280.1 hypothetical protein [Phytoactinopolyspora halotolerans]